MKKAEVIKKKATIVRLLGSINFVLMDIPFSNREFSLERIEFTEIYKYRGTYSVRISNDGWNEKRLYCKSEKYYACSDYCFVLDSEYLDKAIEEMININIDRYQKEVDIKIAAIKSLNKLLDKS